MKTVLIIAVLAVAAWFLLNMFGVSHPQVVQPRLWPNFHPRSRQIAPGTWYYGGRT